MTSGFSAIEGQFKPARLAKLTGGKVLSGAAIVIDDGDGKDASYRWVWMFASISGTPSSHSASDRAGVNVRRI